MIALTNQALVRLYQHIGGEAQLEAILKTFYERMSQDLMLHHFFIGKDLNHIAQMQKRFLMKAMGATPSYSGLAPADAHKQIPDILKGHFDRRLLLLRQVLEEFKLDADQIEVWIRFENAFRSGIVTEEKGGKVP